MYKYDPHQKIESHIKATFINGTKFLDDIIDDLTLGNGKRSNQCVIIFGQRGSGKSHFIRMLYYRIKDSEILHKNYCPVMFPEEMFKAGNLYLFLRDSLERAFKEALQSGEGEYSGIPALYEEFRQICKIRFTGPKKSQEGQRIEVENSLFAMLKKLSNAEGKGIILLLENLQDLFENSLTNNDLRRIRAFLQENPTVLLIIGTAVSVFNSLTTYGEPFYNFFKIRRLRGLDRDEVIQLLKSEASLNGRDDVREKIEKYRGHIDVFRILTGGNPRLVLFLYDLLCENQELAVDDILKKLTELTPYFKSITDQLSKPKQMILDALCQGSPAQTPSGIAEYLNENLNIVNENMKRLEEEGRVKIVETEGGEDIKKSETFYTLVDYFYRIWYQIRQSVSDDENIRWMSEFAVVLYYNEQELRKRHDISGGSLKPVYEKAVELCRDENFMRSIKVMIGKNRDDELLTEMYGLLDEKKWKELDRKADYLIENQINLGFAYFLKGCIFYEEGRYEKSIECCKKTIEIEPDNGDAYYIIAMIYADSGEYRKAIECYKKAIEIKPEESNAYYYMGISYNSLGEDSKAIECYKKAIEIEPDNSSAYWFMGISYDDLEEYSKAIECYKKAIEIKPDYSSAYCFMGISYDNLEEYSKAIECYRKYIFLVNNPFKYEASDFRDIKNAIKSACSSKASAKRLINPDAPIKERISAAEELIALDSFNGIEVVFETIFSELDAVKHRKELKELYFYFMFETIMRLTNNSGEDSPEVTGKYFIKTACILEDGRSIMEKVLVFLSKYFETVSDGQINKEGLEKLFEVWQRECDDVEIPEVLNALLKALKNPNSRTKQVWSADPLFKNVFEKVMDMIGKIEGI